MPVRCREGSFTGRSGHAEPFENAQRPSCKQFCSLYFYREEKETGCYLLWILAHMSWDYSYSFGSSHGDRKITTLGQICKNGGDFTCSEKPGTRRSSYSAPCGCHCSHGEASLKGGKALQFLQGLIPSQPLHPLSHTHTHTCLCAHITQSLY